MPIKKNNKNNKLIKDKGFTLIELLVIIAILGLLAIAVVASLNSVRAKARDSKRISDIKQMSKLLETQEAAGSSDLNGCNVAASNRDVRLCSGPEDVNQFNSLNFQDPLRSTTICNNTASPANCQYSIRRSDGVNRPTTGNYEICFFLEQSVVGVPSGSGMKSIINGGEYRTGCLGN